MDLYYSEKEQVCFAILGYITKVIHITEATKKFAESQNIPLEDVCFQHIYNSSRYRNMIVIYANTSQHNDAFVLSGNWTMNKWLEA